MERRRAPGPGAVTAFALSIARVLGVLGLASAIGWWVTAALLPRSAEFRLERLGWSYAVGVALLSGFVPLSLVVRVRPGWIPFAILGAAVLAVARVARPLQAPAAERTAESRGSLRLLLWFAIVLGVVLYALQALTEPMWSNDYLAIWGLKGKTIFGAGGLPAFLHASADYGFSHPEYPLGLPFLYAGVAFLTARWDDQAMALVFPFFQLASLAALVGWLRRRGAPESGALLAAAILSNFQPLYSAFLTGLAEVPLSFGLLLFGAALADALGPGEPGSLRRLAISAAILSGTKNEGLFLAALGCGAGLACGGGRRWKVAAAALPTALLVHGLHEIWRGRLPLRDFDFGLFSAERLGVALATAFRMWGPAGWIGLGLVAALIVLGARRTDADALLGVAACAAAAYLLLPVFAVRGPEWLARTTLLRTTAALAPLVAAAVALRYAPRSSTA